MKSIDPEVKKQFAKEQVEFLRNNGIRDNERISRIFKAAGPGQVQEAWHLANQADTQAKKDLLDCVLTGAQGSQDFGWRRMAMVLKESGFEPPNATSSFTFFRTLDGALEILVPGGYEFTPEELKEIEEKLGHPRKYQIDGSDEPSEEDQEHKVIALPEDEAEDGIEYMDKFDKEASDLL